MAMTPLTEVPNLTQAQSRYNLCCDACHDIGEADADLAEKTARSLLLAAIQRGIHA